MGELHSEEVNRLWTRSGGDNLLRGARNFQQFFEVLPDSSKTVKRVEGASVMTLGICMDERVIRALERLLDGGYNVVAKAGEGILDPKTPDDWRNLVDELVPHYGCGGKDEYAKANGITNEHPDLAGVRAVRRLGHQLGVPVVRELQAHDLDPMHDARAVYVDGTGIFNWGRVEDMPPGFLISRRYYSNPAQAIAEARVGVQIALGSHGFGHRFGERTPFYVVGVTDERPGSVPSIVLRKELRNIADGFPHVRTAMIVAR